MKKIILKSIVTIAAAFLIFNCSDPASSNDAQSYVVNSQSFLYEADDADYLIDQATGIVTNAETGAVVGVANFTTGQIVASDQITVIAENINFQELEKIAPPVIYSDAYVLSADEVYVIYKNDYKVTDANGNTIGSFVPEINPLNNQPTTVGSIINSAGETVVESVDLTTLKEFHATVNPAPNPNPVSSSSVILPPASSESVPPTPVSSESVILSSESQDPDVSSSSLVIEISSSSEQSASSVQSSSSAQSSSSSAKSSSSSADNSKCPQIKVTGGHSGHGWATRYWDCCAPSCSWPQNAGGNLSKTCDSKGKNTTGGGGSICSGGYQTTCTSQIPFTIDGCSDMAFAFAAVPAYDGGKCGKCFQLTFTGTGKYHGNADGTTGDKNHQAIKGKKLIIMASNVGDDVQSGQFDIMIPGGGFGKFNGCSQMGWNIDSKYYNEYKYGGLLSDCEEEIGYSGNANKISQKRKQCLTEKCGQMFSNDPEAKEGCLFLATWMEAAGNPMHEFTEVECPEVLKQRY